MLAHVPQPSVSRLVLVRLPAPHPDLDAREAYLGPGASVAADLASLGPAPGDPEVADRRLADYLDAGFDYQSAHGPVDAYRALVEFFDQEWIGRTCAAV